ncbi:MAG: MerR family transcriptional regulator [Desulfovibrio sp.]|nr:MerR family transcriptional regulator [Desulfovibrio sp.]
MSAKQYRIGEAAELLELKSYVLRYWETEFPQLAPLRTDKGQRLYSEEHLALLRKIKDLLYTQGMTIEGARRVLESGDFSKPSESLPEESPKEKLKIPELLAELETLRRILLRQE